ncbi:MAG: hypothetical protein IK068_00420 [Lachnospiraceae bacterium]|nr:hypothetical protein [Lachnospiraceae bacterium]
MFKKNLRLRLMVGITFMVLVLFVINSFISTYEAKKRFKNLADAEYSATADYYAEVVDNWFSKNEAILKSTASSASANVDDISKLRPILADIVDNNSTVSEIYFVKTIMKWSLVTMKHPLISLQPVVLGLQGLKQQAEYTTQNLT